MYEKYPMLYERSIVMSFEPHALMAIRLLDEKIGTKIFIPRFFEGTKS